MPDVTAAVNLSYLPKRPAIAVIIDNSGLIIETNMQWIEASSQNNGGSTGYFGSDYFVATEISNVSVAKFLDDLRAVLDGHLSRASYEYFCPEGGANRWYHCKAAPLSRFGKDEPLCALIMHIDITEAKTAEALAVINKNRFNSILDHVPVMIWEKDLRGVYTYCNKMFESLIGLESLCVIGKSDYDIFSIEIAQSFIENDMIAFNFNCSVANEEWVTSALTGQQALYATTKTPVRDETGNIAGILGVAHDITAIREAERAALEASRFKSAFVSNMSHEIRTPMNVIVGFANSLRRSVWNSDDSDKLVKIGHAANHLLCIIDSILDLSKIEAGKLIIESLPFNLHAMISNVLSNVSPIAQSKSLDIQVEVADDFPDWLVGDQLRLSQCLINFGANAIKFTTNGVVTIRVGVEQQVESGLLVRFEVEDTGIGIATDEIPRLFTSFVQADQSTTRRFGGTGLGLALTKELANLMGGDVGVVSAPGKGSRFWFTALLQRAPEGAISDAQGQDVLLETAMDFSHLRLLVAEDVALNREVLQDMLDDAGILADMVENGETAVQKALTFAYDLILMDMQMPVLDGLGATRAIRQLPGYATTPIIALTANAFNEDRERCLNAGMDGFLTKPLHLEDLLAMVARWFGGDRNTQHPQPSGDHPSSHHSAATSDPGSQERPTASGPPPIDLKSLLENLDGNRILARRLLALFCESFAETGREIERLLDPERLEAADNHAHALKGAAGQLAAYPLHNALGALEIALRALPPLVQEVAATLAATLAAADSLKGLASLPDEAPGQRVP